MNIVNSDTPTSDPIKWLIYGNSGAGKTWSLKTLPASMRPVLIIDCDRKSKAVQSEEGFTIVQPDFIGSAGQPVLFTEVWSFCKALLDESIDLPFPCADYRTIVLDSYTIVHNAILNETLTNQLTQAGKDGRPKRDTIDDPPNLPEYGIIGHKATRLLQRFIQLRRNLIFVCHETQTLKDEVTGISQGGPALQRSIATTFPRYFDELLYARVAGQGTSRRWTWATQASGMFEARTSYPELAPEIDQDFGVYDSAIEIKEITNLGA